jgi:hypothetical protein
VKRSTLVTTLFLIVALSACRSDKIDLSYNYEAESSISYRMTTFAHAEWNIGGNPGEGEYEITYDVTESIESVDGDSAVVAVTMDVVEFDEKGLPSPGEQRSTFKLRLGPDGEKLEVIEVDGVPASDLDQTQLAFINTYRPPLPVDPIDLRGTWLSRQAFDLPTLTQEIEPHGELVGLSEKEDGDVAELDYTWEGPLEASMTLPQGTAEIVGDERTTSSVEFDISGGFLRKQTSTTVNSFEVTVDPGDGGAPRPGTLTQNIRSDIELTEKTG